MLFVNNQNSGCFTVYPKNQKAEQFVFAVLNGPRSMEDYNILRDGWAKLGEYGCHQPQFSGWWASYVEKPSPKHIELAL